MLELEVRTFFGVDVDLGGQVAGRILLLVHGEGGNLAVAQVLAGVGVVDTFGNSLRVVGAGPDLLALMANTDGGTGVLAEREDSLGGHAGILQKREGDELVVIARFGVLENLGHLLGVGRAEPETHFLECRLGESGEGLGGDLQNLLAFEFGNRNAFLAEVYVFSLVFAVLHGRFVFECHS